jgi:hypothetical protein
VIDLHQRRKGTYFRVAFAAALTCTVLLSSCKTSDQAAAAAKQLSSTSTDLCSYYKDLSTQVDDTIVLNEIQHAVFGVPFEDQDRAQLTDMKAEIKKRADLAQSLSNLASAYGTLAGSKAAGDASTAANKLGTELQTVKALPKSSPVPDAMSQAANELLDFAKTLELKKGADALQKTVSSIRQLYDNETPAYESIYKQHMVLAASLAKQLVDKDQVDLNSVLAPALKPFDFSPKLQPGVYPPEYKDLAKVEIDQQANEQTDAAVQKTQAMSKSLKDVDDDLTEIVTGKKASKAKA